tara:strand:+ start:268 stop:873 length:606 start_codon:yes stop_codon:yes gene_type:complete
MVYRRILEWPSRKLNEVSRQFDFDKDEQVARDLVDTFRVTGGFGLSAPQIGFQSRVIVINEQLLLNSEDGIENLLMINPKIESFKFKESFQEACFSLPQLQIEVERFSEIEVSWSNLDGKREEKKYLGYSAACIQHEIDHLDGILTIDKLSQLRKNRILKKISKAKRNKVLISKEERDKNQKAKSMKTRKKKRNLRKARKK